MQPRQERQRSCRWGSPIRSLERVNSSAFFFETEDEDAPRTPEWMNSFGGREMGERKEWEK